MTRVVSAGWGLAARGADGTAGLACLSDVIANGSRARRDARRAAASSVWRATRCGARGEQLGYNVVKIWGARACNNKDAEKYMKKENRCSNMMYNCGCRKLHVDM